MEKDRGDETRLLAAMAATSAALDTWRTLATAPPSQRRRRVLEHIVFLGPRLAGRYVSKTPRLREIPPHLNAAERFGSAVTGIVSLATPLHLWLTFVPDRAERRRRAREWSEQRARYRRLRFGGARVGFVEQMRLLAQVVCLPRVAASARWQAFSAGAAAASATISYYTYVPQSWSEMREKFPRYPIAPISAILLAVQFLKMLGLMPSSLWIPRPLRLATRALLILLATLIGTWSGWHALRLATVSPERLQQQHEEFQRETRRRQATRKRRL